MKKIAKLLIIEDEKDLLKGLSDTLTNENFDVIGAMTGKDGLKHAKEDKPNLILLDLRLPDIDGYHVCQELRKDPETKHIPIIMVSTRSKDTEKVVGLEIGADDYVTKPYNPLELLARIRAALRRTPDAHSEAAGEKKKVHEFESVKVDVDLRKVTVEEKPIKLTRKEFDLLAFLIAKPGRPYNRPTLMESIWGHSYDSLHGTVDSHIRTLRKKLGKAGEFVETVPGIGYRWAEEKDDQ